MRIFMNWITLLGLFSTIVTAMLGAQSRPVNQPMPDLISLCQVIEHPDVYDGKLIRFHAIATTDGFESSSLSDPKCNKGVSPWSSEESDRNRYVNSFNKAMESQSRKHVHDNISAVFRGRFEYAPTADNVTRRMRVEIIGVEDLKVSKRR